MGAGLPDCPNQQKPFINVDSVFCPSSVVTRAPERAPAADISARYPTWSESTADGRWRAYQRERLLQRDKASLDIFWLKDAFMTDIEHLPEPEVHAEKIIEHLRSALSSFEAVS